MRPLRKNTLCMCKLENGSVMKYDTCGNDRGGYDPAIFAYLGKGVIHSVNGVKQESITSRLFWRRIPVMTDIVDERLYELGSRAAWTWILREAMRNLGYDNSEAQKGGWVLEREAIIARLRSVCADFGDNDWEESLHLVDVIDKHLARHLYDGKEG